MEERKKKIALIGNPVSHSVSPAIHNAALEKHSSPYTYLAERVSKSDLTLAFDRLRAGEYRGANITIPNKVASLDLVDELSEEAVAVGAINTVVCDQSDHGVILRGYNTDVGGFMQPLDSLTGEAVVFGTGGSARAVVYALSRCPEVVRVTVVSRQLHKASEFVADFRFPDLVLNAATYGCSREYVREANLIVNSTPVGMNPNPESTPWDWIDKPRVGAIVYDLIYSPKATRFLKEASQLGASTIGGLEMLVGQAALSFKLWTGADMDIDNALYVANMRLDQMQ